MVFIWWTMARAFMDAIRRSVVHNNYWHPDRATMFQICGTCLFSLWKENTVWWQYIVFNCKYRMADYQRYSIGYNGGCKWLAIVLHNYRNTLWKAMFQNSKARADAVWSCYYLNLIERSKKYGAHISDRR